jgi:hypothetical protein
MKIHFYNLILQFDSIRFILFIYLVATAIHNNQNNIITNLFLYPHHGTINAVYSNRKSLQHHFLGLNTNEVCREAMHRFIKIDQPINRSNSNASQDWLCTYIDMNNVPCNKRFSCSNHAHMHADRKHEGQRSCIKYNAIIHNPEQ